MNDGQYGPVWSIHVEDDAIVYRLTPLGIHAVRELLACDEQLPSDGSEISGQPVFKHSSDFRSVCWGAQQFAFTPTQAPIVKLLVENWQNGTPDVGSEYLLENVDSPQSRLVDVFRNCKAWGTMIIDGATKGTKRIADPAIDGNTPQRQG